LLLLLNVFTSGGRSNYDKKSKLMPQWIYTSSCLIFYFLFPCGIHINV